MATRMTMNRRRAWIVLSTCQTFQPKLCAGAARTSGIGFSPSPLALGTWRRFSCDIVRLSGDEEAPRRTGHAQLASRPRFRAREVRIARRRPELPRQATEK